jgi:SAM-dependent methyltransferase
MEGGSAKGHYFHQDLWAARRIFLANPKEHIDVGSRIDGFVAHLLTFRSVQVLDVRPLATQLDGLAFTQADLMGTLPANLSADSVSCLHALEHFGLGRYGDRLDLDGWLKGLRNLANLTRPGGRLYLSTPIGDEQCMEFNAQRIFAPATIPVAAASFGLELAEFSFVDDDGSFFQNVDVHSVHCNFGCGCYVFKKASLS